MLNVKPYGDFEPSGKHKNKKQIILCHTAREAEEFLASLHFRYNGKFDRIPNYLIRDNGEIIQLLPKDAFSNFFEDRDVNKNSVIISIENLGWLERKPLKDYYINWKGSIYKGQVFEKKWRDFFFWHPYTNEQLESTAKLCNELIEELSIEKKILGHNTKVEGALEYEGIISRSNIDSRYTDLNPSFNFEIFKKFLENEQFAQ